ncbi:MAG: hypothetical protein KDN18_01130 [Verrucomicrobiae bacterium]|nr:hypothetical protein [Verrucomicrobiae bacterium]
MTAKIAIAVFVVLFLLHQDSWNWDNGKLWFGFLPAGLGYHAAYSVVVALFWAAVNRFAWPHAVEAWAEEGEKD